MEQRKFQRKSRQREVILETLKELDTHPNARELYDSVRTRIPNISLGTVYRNLDLLTEAGLIMKIHVSGSEARFDFRTECHGHTRCDACGRIEDIDGIDAQSFQEQFRDINGFQIQRLCLEIVGLCRDCRDAG